MTWPLPDDEVRRFWSHVVKGPGERDCWCWVGAIADDGYGRFWTRTPEGGQKVLRPHRVTFAMAIAVHASSTTAAVSAALARFQ